MTKSHMNIKNSQVCILKKQNKKTSSHWKYENTHQISTAIFFFFFFLILVNSTIFRQEMWNLATVRSLTLNNRKKTEASPESSDVWHLMLTARIG